MSRTGNASVGSSFVIRKRIVRMAQMSCVTIRDPSVLDRLFSVMSKGDILMELTRMQCGMKGSRRGKSSVFLVPEFVTVGKTVPEVSIFLFSSSQNPAEGVHKSGGILL